MTMREVKAMVAEKYGEIYSINTYQTRKQKLQKIMLEAKLARPENEAQMVKMNETMVYQLKIIGETAERILDTKLDPTDPAYRELEAFKNLVKSMLQRSAEMYEDIDFLGYLRFTINMQKLRMTKLFGLELQTGIPMRDNTDNIRVMIDMLERGIQMHKELGLKPTFGDPTVNLTMNVGAGGNVNIGGSNQSERNSRLDEIEKAVKGLQGDERDKKIRELLFPPVDAKFEDVKRAESDMKT
jgi:hypothetical protein